MSRASADSSFLSRCVAVGGGLLFAASLVFFAANYAGPFGRDAGPWSLSLAATPALLDLGLFSLFALHHSLFARTGLKTWIDRLAPPVLERSIYVWVASALFIVTCGLWQPVPGRLWTTEGPVRWLIVGVQAGGAIFTLVAAARLDNLALAGVRQVLAPVNDAPPRLQDTGPFGLVRHPIYFGWFLMVWATPAMTGTRLVFAVVSCAYLVLAIPFEERDLRRIFGPAYEAYARAVPWRALPWIY